MVATVQRDRPQDRHIKAWLGQIVGQLNAVKGQGDYFYQADKAADKEGVAPPNQTVLKRLANHLQGISLQSNLEIFEVYGRGNEQLTRDGGGDLVIKVSHNSGLSILSCHIPSKLGSIISFVRENPSMVGSLLEVFDSEVTGALTEQLQRSDVRSRQLSISVTGDSNQAINVIRTLVTDNNGPTNGEALTY